MLRRLIWFYITTSVLYTAHGLTLPENPCPEVFEYQTSGDGNVYGQARIPYDGSNRLVFSVNVSFSALFQGRNLKISLENPPRSTSSSEKVTYDIFFPFPNLLPKITEIVFNGQTYCMGPPELLTPGKGVTNLWASHFYEFYGGVSGPSNGFNYIEQQYPRKPVQSTTAKYESIPSGKPQSNGNVPTKVPNGVDTESFDNISDIIQSIFTSPKPGELGDVLTNSKSSVGRQCGVSSLAVPLVFGGTDVVRGQFPWLGAVFAYNFSANSYDYKCTANLISEKHVITAAGCVQYYKIQLVATEDILIVLGNNDLSRWATNGAVARSASKVMVHPEFKNNPNSANADIALITLNEPVTFTKAIKPICLWGNKNISLDPFVNKQGLVAGWGKDERTSGLHVFRSKYVQIPIVSQIECLKSNAIIAKITSENTFCAGDLTGSGPCIGDGGAGFVISQNGVYYLRGISSRTMTRNGVCTLDENFAIFCDVAKYMPWVKESMSQ